MPSPANQCPVADARVRTVAQVPAVELGRDRTVDRQVEFGQFVGDRRVVAALEEVAGTEQGVGVLGIGSDFGHGLDLLSGWLHPDTPLMTCQ